MAEVNTWDFPTIKRGDTFYPAFGGDNGGLEFEYLDDVLNVGMDDLDITVQFKTCKGYLRQTFSTTASTEPNHVLIERLGNGKYRIPPHNVELRPDVYYYDWEAVRQDGLNTTVSSTTGKWIIEQDISNSKI